MTYREVMKEGFSAVKKHPGFEVKSKRSLTLYHIADWKQRHYLDVIDNAWLCLVTRRVRSTLTLEASARWSRW
ncbi:hypothetical protein SAMN04487974_13014 [Pelagibacterium luteolum]|uniref:Uncharacterized protein n=1 Tax=Pelagibacterium luteolum TaxID=440168 RepID=A0A1G8AH00_9HYPH|nr:hypothetical protein SAMN04487974_13014 [Pelagibacterium luteolum]